MSMRGLNAIPALVLATLIGGGLATATFAGAGPAAAAEKAADAKPKRDPGKRIFMRKTCIACHGRDGKKAIMDYPNLAGQDVKYMISQMEDIISGKRVGSPDETGNPRTEGMRGALVTADGEVRITDEEIKLVSTWLSDMEPAPVQPLEPPVTEERMAAGAAAYKKGRCRTCHGPEGKKPLKGYPYIAGQKRNYIIAQMTDTREKIRTNGRSKLMFPFVRKMEDEEIALIADYLSQIDRTAD
ncbi:c-type cytochrome [Rhodobium gokarnense]|uniref:Cytochrome c553 n=1 Tax=Rhodobium gokarnense TaxID=364296 RepID=A0ABT3H7Y8_9HYPH|nr:c-type cytochrome [Rhodobium gokarnense]MCW2306488.1 cytochrome c553 [Rhodobium gokarnense]